MEQLQYPIGKFKAPDGYDQLIVQEGINYLGKFPALLTGHVAQLTEEQLQTPYREGGWTVKQLVHHIADSHANAYIRFKLALTEDNPVIKPYNEAEWAKLPDTLLTPISISLQLTEALHKRWTNLLENMNKDDFNRTYAHPQYKTVTPLWSALALYHWHSNHHLKHITNLKENMGWK